MKFKTLKRISPVDSKYDEFASFDEFGNICTQEHPHAFGDEVTIEALKEYCNEGVYKEVDWDNYRIVEIEYNEAGVVGADIRNKLTPPLNLLALLRIYFSETDNALDDVLNKEKVLPFIKKEMIKCEENIKYLSNLL